MGAAEVIPGVSGGTVAFITGIFDELLASIKAIDLEALRLLTKFRLHDFWQKINGNFLVVLFAGVITSMITLARLMTHLLSLYPILVWAFFFGLIIIAAPLVLRDIKVWTLKVYLAPLVGIAIAYAVTILSPMHLSNTPTFVFLAGALSICAMILPGISGAFLLLLIGKYEYIVTSMITLNLSVILVFVAGSVVGIISFSRFLSWILENYRDITIALLAGFMIGSLNKIWPWRNILEYVTNSKGEQIPAFDRSVLPWDYFTKTGKDPLILQAILMMALGVIMVVFIEKVAARLKTKN
jgi:putative membrane protein